MVDPGDMDIWHRLICAYQRVHPSMYYYLEWRMSETTLKLLITSNNCVGGLTFGDDITLFNIKISIIDTDEILLVMVM